MEAGRLLVCGPSAGERLLKSMLRVATVWVVPVVYVVIEGGGG